MRQRGVARVGAAALREPLGRAIHGASALIEVRGLYVAAELEVDGCGLRPLLAALEDLGRLLELDEVVLEWEKNFDIWLDKIKERRASGEADEEEAWPLTNLEHTVLMYDMMMKQVLEKLDPVPGNTKDSALAHLADRIQGSLNASAPDILNTLGHAVQRGYLRLTEKEGSGKWEWIDYL